MYAASYLVRTGGLRWAIDPVRLKYRLPTAPPVDYAAALAPLSLVLLTHRHKDHLDLDLIRSLGPLPITWVVPEPMFCSIARDAGIPAKRIIVPEPSMSIQVSGLCITPFEGMHWEASPSGREARVRGVPAMGYLVEHAGKRWLFPGDTRTYDANALPRFGPVDILFAHVWLGRGAARGDPSPLLDEFCRWCSALEPRRVVLTHLEEFGREPDDFWTKAHAQRAAERIRHLRPGMQVLPRLMGQSVKL